MRFEKLAIGIPACKETLEENSWSFKVNMELMEGFFSFH